MKWITREHPKIDRIACPWLLLRFIDADAEFHFVPTDQVIAMAETIGATPYDIPGVELRDFTRTLRHIPRRSRDAAPRPRDVRRALRLVQVTSTRNPPMAPGWVFTRLLTVF
jgi:hypothetical protein